MVLLPPAPEGRADEQVGSVLAASGSAAAPRAPDEHRVRLSVAVSAPGSADVVALLDLAGARMLACKDAEG